MAALIAIRSHYRPALGWIPLTLAAALGCGSDTTGPAPVPANQLYWAVPLNVRAVTLALTAPYDTTQLVAIPIDANGDPLKNGGVVSYHATDSTVTVSATGLVTAHYVTAQTFVVASLTMNGVTHTDTAFLEVTPTRSFSVASLALHSQPGPVDSARLALGRNITLSLSATDSSGAEQCNAGCPFPAVFTSSNIQVATVDRSSGRLTTVNVGRTLLQVAARVYGVDKRDSLNFTVGYRILWPGDITAGSGGTPLLDADGFTIGVGGRMPIENDLSQPVEIVFPYQTHQIRIIGKALYQLTDTIKAGGVNSFEFDSAGTYTSQMTVLGPGGGQTGKGSINVSAGP